jgi:polysaccharide biosynthesis protein VpsM
MKTLRGTFLYSGVAVFCSVVLSGNVQAMQIDKLAVVAANDLQPAAADSMGQDMPMGQSATGQDSLLPEDAGAGKADNLFGEKGGYFHPYIMLEEAYTDNVYDVRSNRTSSSRTTVSPGIWLAVPGKKEVPVAITPHNTSPGGLQYQFKDHEGRDRIQAYALGGLDFKYYSANSDLNTTSGVLEGLFRYNMRGGLSLQLVDRYTHGEDGFNSGVPGAIQAKYNSNFALATVDWRITEKFRTKLEYSNFWLDYDDYAFRSRVDNGIDLYAYYVYSPKTSFFLEDKLVDVHYSDTSGSMNDNTQNFVYAGIKWDTTEKVAILAKTGLQTRNFDDNGPGNVRKDYKGLAADLQVVYRATVKTKFTLDLYRTDEETDYTSASGKLVTGATFGYRQKYTDKISGSLDVTYENADYAQLIAQKRDDDRLFIRPAVQYLFREWLIGEIAYEFDKRYSSYDVFDYQSNTILLNLKFAL